jgi:flagellar protein FliO/FliZ
MNAVLWALPAALLLLALPAAGADPPAAPPLTTVSFSSLVQVLFALLLVLAAIGFFAWLLRRLSPGNSATAGLRVVGGVMVGPRERLVVVEVGETWLLLGVASGNVSLVHSMARPPQPAAAAAQTPAQFSRLLRQMIRQRKGHG